MILDRLKAQPELMEALGVEWLGKLYANLPDRPIQFPVELDADDCPGSALLTHRAKEWILGEGLCYYEYGYPGDRSLHVWRPGKTFEQNETLFNQKRPTLVEAALLAVLEVAEGK